MQVCYIKEANAMKEKFVDFPRQISVFNWLVFESVHPSKCFQYLSAMCAHVQTYKVECQFSSYLRVY